MDVGSYIRAIRLRKGITLEELAHLVGTTKSTISKYELGRRQLTPSLIEQIAAALGVPLEWLIVGPPKEDSKAEAPPPEQSITMDDFTIAFQAETKELTETDKQILLTMARELRAARNKEAHSEDK